MSEPVSNAEVEDVLASIRRLVSEEKRAPRPVPAPAVNPDLRATANGEDRLVLTQSLRVQQSEDAADEAWSNGHSRDVAPEAPMAVDVEEELTAEPTPFVLSQESHTAETDFSDDEHAEPTVTEPLTSTPHDVTTAVENLETMLDARHHDTADHIDDLSDTDTVSLNLEPGSPLAAAIDEVTTNEPQDYDFLYQNAVVAEPEPEHVEAESGVEADSTGASGDDSINPADEFAEPEPFHSLPFTTDVQAVSDPVATPDALSAKIAALEEVIGRKLDHWEPDGVVEDPYSGTEDPSLQWEDHVEPAELAEQSEEDAVAMGLTASIDIIDTQAEQDAVHDESHTVEAPAPQPAEVEPSQATLEDPILDEAIIGSVKDSVVEAAHASTRADLLDEAALRDMVSEIVRQELQGGLGERITRNVRKLVRREIHRAMATQDLD